MLDAHIQLTWNPIALNFVYYDDVCSLSLSFSHAPHISLHELNQKLKNLDACVWCLVLASSRALPPSNRNNMILLFNPLFAHKLTTHSGCHHRHCRLTPFTLYDHPSILCGLLYNNNNSHSQRTTLWFQTKEWIKWKRPMPKPMWIIKVFYSRIRTRIQSSFVNGQFVLAHLIGWYCFGIFYAQLRQSEIILFGERTLFFFQIDNNQNGKKRKIKIREFWMDSVCVCAVLRTINKTKTFIDWVRFSSYRERETHSDWERDWSRLCCDLCVRLLCDLSNEIHRSFVAC